MKSFSAAIILLLATPAFAAGKASAPSTACVKGLLNDKKFNAALNELVQLQIEVLKIDNIPEKKMALEDLKSRMRQMREALGEDLFNEEFNKRFDQDAKTAKAKANQEKQKTEEIKGKEDESLLRFTRLKNHPVEGSVLAQLDDSTLLIYKNASFTYYDYKKRKDVPGGFKLAGRNNRDFVTVSPDKKWAIAASKTDIVIVDLEEKKVVKTLPFTSHRGFRVGYITKDSRTAILGGEDSEFVVVDFATKSISYSQTPPGNYFADISESPNGRYILASQTDDSQVLWDRETNKVVPMPNLNEAKIYHLYSGVFDKHSEVIFFRNNHHDIFAYHIASNTYRMRDDGVWGDGLSISKDGRYLVVSRDIGNREEGTMPFEVLSMENMEKVPVDLSQFKFNRPSNFMSSQHKNLFYFFDQPDDGFASLYVLDLATLKVMRYKFPDKPRVFGSWDFTMDGKSVLVYGNGAPILEIR